MKVLIIGGGRFEHPISRKLLENATISQLYFAPDKGGTAQIGTNIPLGHPKSLCTFTKTQATELTILGSETLLAEGIIDTFQVARLKIFSPQHQVAQLESTKVLAKAFMKKYGVRRATYESFSDHTQKLNHLKQVDYPVIIKTSGLAAGKRVIIASDHTEAQTTLEAMMEKNIFGTAGYEVVIKTFLQGYEPSVLSIFNGKQIIPFLSAKDHKKIGGGETGLNIGGMGVITPIPYMNKEPWEDFQKNILQLTLQGLLAEKWNFSGMIFFGLMLTKKGVYFLEYNLRMVDPQSQAILLLMESDFLELIQKALRGEDLSISWRQAYACCVVMASGGYHEKYKKGKTLSGLDLLTCPYYISEAEKKDNQWITSGGRALNLISNRSLCARSPAVGLSRSRKNLLQSSLFPTRYRAFPLYYSMNLPTLLLL
ncbi:MAG: phosphoribosylamine--glycine ligase [Flavobacteriales bacterium AspAUS03]